MLFTDVSHTYLSCLYKVVTMVYCLQTIFFQLTSSVQTESTFHVLAVGVLAVGVPLTIKKYH